MKKLTTGIFTVLLGLVAIDANAAITSKAYVDAKVSTEVGKVNTKVTELNTTVNDFTTNIDALEGTVGTAELATTDKTLTGAINELNTNKVTQAQVTTIITNSITAEEGAIKDAIDTAVSDKADKTQVATDIAAAVKVETDRATAAEQANANAIAANTAAVEQAQADATQALSESIKQIKATGEDGTYVLTIKTIGDQATLKWEQIERAEATQTPEA